MVGISSRDIKNKKTYECICQLLVTLLQLKLITVREYVDADLYEYVGRMKR